MMRQMDTKAPKQSDQSDQVLRDLSRVRPPMVADVKHDLTIQGTAQGRPAYCNFITLETATWHPSLREGVLKQMRSMDFQSLARE